LSLLGPWRNIRAGTDPLLRASGGGLCQTFGAATR